MLSFVRGLITLLICLSVFVSITNFVSATLTFLVWAMTVFLITVVNKGAPLRSKSFRLLASFYIVALIYFLFGFGEFAWGGFRGHVYNMICAFALFIIPYQLKRLSSKSINLVFFACLISLLISIASNTVISFATPEALRLYGTGIDDAITNEIASVYYSMGMMSYANAHAMPLVATSLCVLSLYSKYKYQKLLGFVLLLLLFRVFFVMTVTTAFLATIISCIFVIACFFGKGRIKRTIFYAFFVTVLSSSTGLVYTALGSVSSSDNNQIAKKIDDLTSSLKSGKSEGQVAGRNDYYMMSIKTFISNPLFGGGEGDEDIKKEVGHHSFLLDYFAYYGLFALLFLLAWWRECKSFIKHLHPDLHLPYYINLIPLAIMMTMKGSFAVTPYMSFSLIVVPVIFIYLNNQKTVMSNNRKYDNKNFYTKG